MIGIKEARPLDKKRAAIDPKEVCQFFIKLNERIETLGHPSLLVNADESGFQRRFDKGRSKKVVYFRSCTVEPRYYETIDSHHLTLMGAVSGDCSKLKPFVLSTKNIPKDIQNSVLFSQMIFRKTKKGYMTKESFREWVITVFIPYIEHKRKKFALKPQNSHAILLLDNLSTHSDEEISDLMSAHDFEVIFYPPNCTHILQCLDIGIFGTMKRMYYDSITEHKCLIDKLSRKIDHAITCFIRAATKMNIQSAWSSSGLTCVIGSDGAVTKIHANITKIKKIIHKINKNQFSNEEITALLGMN